MTRILVADDDRTTRLLLSETLRAQKFSTVCVADGAAALKKMNDGKFDLVLLDIWMPKMNGLEVLKKIRNTKNRPKVIVMTSDDAPETLLSAIREEAYQYVSKPVEPRALLSLVRETLEKKARALEVPMYQLFYDGEAPPKLVNLPKGKSGDDIAFGSRGKDAKLVDSFQRLLAKTSAADQKLLMFMAQKIARAK